LAAQDAELMAAGCAKVFKEKISGAKTNRPELVKAIGRLEPGVVLVVTAAGSAGQVHARPAQRDRGDCRFRHNGPRSPIQAHAITSG
jgi:DNA invertase Pin-like site-specific DNA recombinase